MFLLFLIFLQLYHNEFKIIFKHSCHPSQSNYLSNLYLNFYKEGNLFSVVQNLWTVLTMSSAMATFWHCKWAFYPWETSSFLLFHLSDCPCQKSIHLVGSSQHTSEQIGPCSWISQLLFSWSKVHLKLSLMPGCEFFLALFQCRSKALQFYSLNTIKLKCCCMVKRMTWEMNKFNCWWIFLEQIQQYFNPFLYTNFYFEFIIFISWKLIDSFSEL